MSRRVQFSDFSQADLERIYRYIAEQSSPERALSFTSAIHAHCMGLRTFPFRGASRDDIRPGLRILPFRRRVIIAYHVDGTTVFIDNILYGGRDLPSALD